MSETTYQKVLKLVKQYEQLRKENFRLKDILEQNEQKLEQEKKTIQFLKDQIAVLSATGAPLNESTKKEFEKKIQQYIKDIDKVISLLNE